MTLKTVMAALRIYRAWIGMNQRCHNPTTKSFSDYGALGIKVCPRWRESFESFLADIGTPPNKFSKPCLDRINPRGNYEPKNCRWVNTQTSVENRKNTRWIAYQGKVKTATAWGRKFGMPAATIVSRILKGETDPRRVFFPGKLQWGTFEKSQPTKDTPKLV